MTLAEQLANVGSEYGRAKKWKQKNKEQLFWSAFSRMLELLDLTINDPRWHNHRLKELCRLREFICTEFLTEHNTQDNFQKYFLQFNVLARKN